MLLSAKLSLTLILFTSATWEWFEKKWIFKMGFVILDLDFTRRLGRKGRPVRERPLKGIA
jgi:hypothetical protein